MLHWYCRESRWELERGWDVSILSISIFTLILSFLERERVFELIWSFQEVEVQEERGDRRLEIERMEEGKVRDRRRVRERSVYWETALKLVWKAIDSKFFLGKFSTERERGVTLAQKLKGGRDQLLLGHRTSSLSLSLLTSAVHIFD